MWSTSKQLGQSVPLIGWMGGHGSLLIPEGFSRNKYQISTDSSTGFTYQSTTQRVSHFGLNYFAFFWDCKTFFPQTNYSKTLSSNTNTHKYDHWQVFSTQVPMKPVGCHVISFRYNFMKSNSTVYIQLSTAFWFQKKLN